LQLRGGEGTALVLAAWLLGCGRTNHHDEPAEVGGHAGQGGVDAGQGGGVAGGVVAFGGAGGLQLAGFPPVMGGTGGEYIAQPLEDTALCDNVFERVARLPDEPLSFTATFDGEPVEVQSSSLPVFGVFRFGRSHVEALSFDFEFAEHSGAIYLSAVECGLGGNMLKRQDGQVVASFSLASGTLSSRTSSVDGFVGVSRGTLHSEWSNEAGEKHVLEASFFLHAPMSDARAQQQP
jgi:hypothetical protein